MSDSDSYSSALKANKKRKCSYNSNWECKYSWLRKNDSVDFAECIICKTKFCICHGGEYDVKRHSNGSRHKDSVQRSETNASSNILKFFQPPQTTNAKLVSAAEAVFVYHSVKHAHSFVSVNCASSIFGNLFSDSIIAKQFTCGRTKSCKIAQNILAPASRKVVLNDLKDGKYFAIGTDASNKGNIKTFPFIIRYFKKDEGIKTKLLNFFSMSSENSESIAKELLDILTKNNLSIANVTAYSADNASVNFGIHQSVYVELKKLNENINALGCCCHILHNTLKKASTALRFDIETVIIMCYNEFSSSTKNVTKLKEIVDWADQEWSELLPHVPTRWLTLVPAVERLLKHFIPVKEYFLSKDKTRGYLRKFFNHMLAEAYLGFILHIGTLFKNAVLKLESEETLCTDIYNIMYSVKTNVEAKLEEKFFGSLAQSVMNNCDDLEEVRRLEKQMLEFYKIAICYLNKNYNFVDNKFEQLRFLNLDQCPQFKDFVRVVETFRIPNVDNDLLFNEYVLLKSFCNDKNNLAGTVIEKWVKFFTQNIDIPNFERICNYIFSFPNSNASSERIFSLMVTTWRKDRNRLLLKNVEAELLIKQNFDYSCNQFKNFLLKTDEGQEVLKQISSMQKYYG